MEQKKLRFGIVGVGGIGHGHVDGVWECELSELVAICDPMGEDAKNFKDYSHCKWPENLAVFTDFDEFIEYDMDAIIISSPDVTHCPYTVKALEKGIHVMCEKPLTPTNEEAAKIVEAEKKSSARAFVGQICRFTPAFVKAKELIDSGALGEVFCIESQYRHNCHENLPRDDWRIVDPRPATACGGCHAIDIVRYLTGDKVPTEVFAFGNRFCRKDWVVEDCSETVMKFPGDIIARVFTSLGSISPYSMHTAIYGTKATIITDNTWEKLDFITRNEETKELNTEEIPVPVNNHNCEDQVREMCRAILFGEPARHNIIEGAKSIYVCNAAIKSINTGEKIVPDYSTLD